ncbi:hypothetical protein U0070_010529 [Myodes glareolus]|uniref:Uncharacterized protein n=1 Tax=Myodes glareolus TaxID=447135 RepID=A0AAW0I5Q4_MYOGA
MPRPICQAEVIHCQLSDCLERAKLTTSTLISYLASQGAYYIAVQGRSTYVVPKQYPVQPGAPGFYPGESPTEFGTYAGAYYPAQESPSPPPSVDLSCDPVSEPKEVSSVAPVTILSATPPMAPSDTSDQEEEVEEEEEGRETESEKSLGQPEEADETWDSKEDKIHHAESIQPGEQKYEYKSDQWKPLNLERKKRYDKEFLLGFQFIFASMQKPEGLPHITDVVLDKANKTPLWQLDPFRLPVINCGPDFTPSFANLG